MLVRTKCNDKIKPLRAYEYLTSLLNSFIQFSHEEFGIKQMVLIDHNFKKFIMGSFLVECGPMASLVLERLEITKWSDVKHIINDLISSKVFSITQEEIDFMSKEFNDQEVLVVKL